MAAWLLTISKDFPQHWDYAKEHGVWDMISPRSIKAGDVVYFWQSGASLLGKVSALEDAYDIDPDEVAPGPWDDWPGSTEKPYAKRSHLEVLAGSRSSNRSGCPRWSRPPGSARTRRSCARSMRSSRRFWATTSAATRLPSAPSTTHSVSGSSTPWTRISVSARCRWWRCGRGQPRCRGALLRTYGGRCAITGTAVASVLEAAHIWPLKGEHTNGIWNGLLLRADLHTLFDLFLLTVDADSLEVRVSPALQDTEYAALDGRLLTAPPTQGDQPAREALVKHNEDCAGWLST